MTWFFHPLRPCAYEVILIDPPTRWESFTPFESAKGPDYPTMSREWLLSLPVQHLAAADCLVCLWSTFPQLEFSFELLRAWGFRYVTGGAWFKRTVNGKIAYGTGKVVMSGAEPFLLAAAGRPRYVKRPVKGVFETDREFDSGLAEAFETDLNALRREHSRKPDELYGRLETLMGDVPRVELFAQQRWPGWDAWGNNVDRYAAAATDETRS
ncbi:MAG: MT-A70 family methyltransferase [Alphaproteobacteria bacterium]